MSTFDERDTKRTGFDYSELNSSTAPAWILGAIVAVFIVGDDLVRRERSYARWTCV